ncbi:MAG: carboxypeptidase-like regulatory domain-containing protein, partial [Bacteroidales bacterium]|nr:carboxypeptidase-like regulatory domain-containing protein [Bacteroidales bacterium]
MKQAILKSAAFIVSFLLIGVTAFAQPRPLTGKVVDKNGEPVVGAAVVVVGNNAIGTETNLDGVYTLMVPPQASITVSCIGYAEQTVAVAGRPVVNFTLEEDTEFLDETVVIGYGVQRKSDLTGAVASVRSEDLQNRSTSDAAAALQGKAAGVQILNN